MLMPATEPAVVSPYYLGLRNRERLMRLLAYGLLILAIVIVFFPSHGWAPSRCGPTSK
ncbi:hypothetical protein [Chelatococcus sp. CO-6]|uniref:hypothetical protein n=1 Tax=Chelatococcus sp. CO-6 TaxID=1702325 RepID=UPI000ADB0EF3|nr:hypothetical protein [Chelatococcus sp. CO-6]